jgi:hypothetical protein
LKRRLGGPQGRSGRFRKEETLLSLPEFEHRTVELVATLYTDSSPPVPLLYNDIKIYLCKMFSFSGALKLKKKMLFPILLGVALKFMSLFPLVLGKLAFIGTMAITASKLSLILTGIMGLKKLLSGADGGLSQQGQYYHDGHYTYYGGGVPVAQQRMTYVVRGRQMGDQEDWTPLVMDESRGLVTDDDKGRFINQKGAKGSKSVRYFAQYVGYGDRDNVRGVSGNTYATTNENKVHDDSNYGQTTFLESTEASATRAMNSQRNASYETDKNRTNLFYQKRQLQHLDMKNKRQDRNLAQGDLNPNTMSHGDIGSVTHHGALYTRDSAETRVESHVTDDRYDEKSKESVSGGHDEFEAQYKEEKGPQNKATRLAKRHYKGENEGQNHDRNYRAGRRRLDEVEGEHTDASATSRKADHA